MNRGGASSHWLQKKSLFLGYHIIQPLVVRFGGKRRRPPWRARGEADGGQQPDLPQSVQSRGNCRAAIADPGPEPSKAARGTEQRVGRCDRRVARELYKPERADMRVATATRRLCRELCRRHRGGQGDAVPGLRERLQWRVDISLPDQPIGSRLFRRLEQTADQRQTLTRSMTLTATDRLVRSCRVWPEHARRIRRFSGKGPSRRDSSDWAGIQRKPPPAPQATQDRGMPPARLPPQDRPWPATQSWGVRWNPARGSPGVASGTVRSDADETFPNCGS